MWPFNRRKSKADAAIEWMPRAIEVASQKWSEFERQPFAADWPLEEKIYQFSLALGKGLKQWEAFKDSPNELMLLIAAKGVERSGTHLRIEIEVALGFPLPAPHDRTDEQEKKILMDRLVDRACKKWQFFDETLKFKKNIPLKRRIELFQIPFLQGLKHDMPMLNEAPDSVLLQMIVLGITKSGTLSPDEIEAALDMVS